MPLEIFERLVEEEFPNAIPEKFRARIANVAFLVEDEPDTLTRQENELGEHDTLLGLYKGVPHTARGGVYGIGPTLPDTITLFRVPLLEEATRLRHSLGGDFEVAVRKAIRETIWHEVAHHFGMDEHEVNKREDERDRGMVY